MCYVIIKDKMRMGIYHNINIWIDGKIIELKPKSEIKINKNREKIEMLFKKLSIFYLTFLNIFKIIIFQSHNKY